MGSVPQGSTLSDYDKEEQRRGFSISTALIPVEYTDQDAEPVKINFLDPRVISILSVRWKRQSQRRMQP